MNMTPKYFRILSVIFLAHTLNLHALPDLDAIGLTQDRRADWSDVGLAVSKPVVEHVIDFVGQGGIADGKTDNAPLLQQLIDTQQESSVIFLPEGDYLFKSIITIGKRPDGVALILRGSGWNKTRLHFDAIEPTNRGLIDIVGNESKHPAQVINGTQRGSFEITVDDTTGFNVGDGVVITQQNNRQAMDTIIAGDLMPEKHYEALDTWAARSVGQSNQVTAIDGNRLKLRLPLNIDYTWGDVQAQKTEPVECVGLEDFSMINQSNVNGLRNFRFVNAANCWIDNVFSYKAVRLHVYLTSVRNLEIRNCFFDDAFRHGGGGHGYGISCASQTNNCLIENNIFRRLRHSMMVKEGASQNVFAYNLSFEGFQEGSTIAKDVSIHGHYPFMNLFEGNSVEFIHSTDYWGAAGPGNTFFRNRITTSGIRLEDYSAKQNVLANEVLDTPEAKAFFAYGDKAEMKNGIAVCTEVIEPLVAFNRSNRENTPANSPSLPASLYLKEKPAFWPADLPWPAFGPEFAYGTHRIPAQLRWAQIEPYHRRPLGMPLYASDWSQGWDSIFWREGTQAISQTPEGLLVNTTVKGDGIQALNSTLWNKAPLTEDFYIEATFTIETAPDTASAAGLILMGKDPEGTHLLTSTLNRTRAQIEKYAELQGIYLPIYQKTGNRTCISLKGMEPLFELPEVNLPVGKPVTLKVFKRGQSLTLYINDSDPIHYTLKDDMGYGFFALRCQWVNIRWHKIETMRLLGSGQAVNW
jgi:hypothetical protein